MTRRSYDWADPRHDPRHPEWGDPRDLAETWRMLRFLAVIATLLIVAAYVGSMR